MDGCASPWACAESLVAEQLFNVYIITWFECASAGVLSSCAHVLKDSVGELSSGAHVFKVPFGCSRCLHGVRQALVPVGVLAVRMDLGPCVWLGG